MPINTMAMQAPYTDYGQELEELQRRQKYAEMLREQSMQAPQAPEAKGRLSAPTHWTQLAAGLLKNASALNMQQEGHKERKALSQRYQAESHKNLADALMKAHGRAGQGVMPTGTEADQYDQTPYQAPVPPDPMGALGTLAKNPNAALQSAAMGGFVKSMMPEEPYTLAQGAQRIGRGGKVVAENPPEFKPPTPQPQSNLARLQAEMAALPPNDPRRAAYQNAIRKESETPRQISPTINMPRPDPAPVVQTAEDGTVRFFDRQGNLLKEVEGAGKPAADYLKQRNQKEQLRKDIDRAIVEIREASKDGGLIDQSTGSGIGRGVDIAAGLVGQATSGAVAVGQMKPIYDMVLKMVPRFEGPQSDKDTMSYAQAAGQLADPNIPNRIKKAAAKEILRLMEARKDQFVTKDMEAVQQRVQTPQRRASDKPGGVVDFSDLPE